MKVLNDIIISSYTPNLAENYTDYVATKLKEAERAIEIAKLIEGIDDNPWFTNIKRGIIKTEFDGILITREDKDGNIVPNYEEIDSKHIHLRSGTELYSTATGLKEYLEQEKHKVTMTTSIHSFSQEQINQLNAYREKVQEEKLAVTELIYDLLKKEETKGLFDFSKLDIQQLMFEATGTAKKLLLFYLEFKDLEALKESNGDDSFINKYRLKHSYLKLESNHMYKREMAQTFKHKMRFTSQEIGIHINRINQNVGITTETIPDVRALKLLKRFVTCKRCKIVTGIGVRTDGYEITGMAA